MRGEHLRESSIRLRGFIEIATAQDDPFIMKPFHHFVVPDEAVLTDSFVTDLDEPAFRCSTRHDAAGAVNC